VAKGYSLKFDFSSYNQLERFARQANRKCHLGDKGDWLNHFLWGLEGLHARLLGVQLHYREIHSWELVDQPGIPFYELEVRLYLMTEYHLSTILFHMDSAIECMVFALNALGYATNSAQFKDVTKVDELRRISPYNILGKPPNYSGGFVPGHESYFPSLKSYWHENRDLILKISEQHDVSKHRSSIFEGGRERIDPPDSLFERLGIEDDNSKQIVLSPFAEIPLRP